MSQSDRKAFRTLVCLKLLAENKHYMQYETEMLVIIDNLLSMYMDISEIQLSKTVKDEFDKFGQLIDDNIEDVDSSVIMMLSLNIGLAEYFLEWVKHDLKRKMWLELLEVSKGHLAKNYLMFVDEIEKADGIVEVIVKALTN